MLFEQLACLRGPAHLFRNGARDCPTEILDQPNLGKFGRPLNTHETLQSRDVGSHMCPNGNAQAEFAGSGAKLHKGQPRRVAALTTLPLRAQAEAGITMSPTPFRATRRPETLSKQRIKSVQDYASRGGNAPFVWQVWATLISKIIGALTSWH